MIDERIIEEYIGKYIFIATPTQNLFAFFKSKINTTLRLELVDFPKDIDCSQVIEIRKLTDKEISIFNQKRSDLHGRK